MVGNKKCCQNFKKIKIKSKLLKMAWILGAVGCLSHFWIFWKSFSIDPFCRSWNIFFFRKFSIISRIWLEVWAFSFNLFFRHVFMRWWSGHIGWIDCHASSMTAWPASSCEELYVCSTFRRRDFLLHRPILYRWTIPLGLRGGRRGRKGLY